jgi:hypothetical protein
MPLALGSDMVMNVRLFGRRTPLRRGVAS